MIVSTRVVELIEVRSVEGDSASEPMRIVTAYFAKNGERVAVIDPLTESACACGCPAVKHEPGGHSPCMECECKRYRPGMPARGDAKQSPAHDAAPVAIREVQTKRSIRVSR